MNLALFTIKGMMVWVMMVMVAMRVVVMVVVGLVVVMASTLQCLNLTTEEALIYL